MRYRTALLGCAVVLLLAFLVVKSQGIDAGEHNRYTADLRRLQLLDARLYQDILESRYGYVRHYDYMVWHLRDLERLQIHVSTPPGFLGNTGRRDVERAVSSYVDLHSQKLGLIERFKSENAILENSLNYFPVAVSDLVESVSSADTLPDVVARLNVLLRYVLIYNLTRDDEIALEIRVLSEKLYEHRDVTSLSGVKIGDAIAHADSILRHKPVVDALIEKVNALATRERSEDILRIYNLRYDRALGVVQVYRLMVFVLCLALVVLGASFTINRLRRSASALIIARDNLAQARDEAEAANRAKSAFLASMSHELRTPLNAIILYGEMLQEDAQALGEDGFVSDLEKILIASRHLLKLINAVLDLAKIESGELAFNVETFDISTLIEGTLDTIQPLVKQNANTLQVNLGANLGKMHADQTKVRQCLFNLLSNASKFTKSGTISVNVARELRDRQDWVRFAVGDTGIGLNDEQMQRIFDPFIQVGSSSSAQLGGTGLGLAITRRFCEAMGGEISVESKIGSGSTFVIHLPAGDSEHTDVSSADESARQVRSEALPASARMVLVIDDDPAVRELMQRFLSKEGYRVTTASGGHEGLRLASELRPDAITLDVVMPDLDGWLVLQALKADSILAEIPVIMLTIMDRPRSGFALGVADYVTKPIDRGHLLATLKRFERGRVLIVEDDTASREAARRILKQEGWTVDEAENGRFALECMQARRPDLVLLDLMMPEMDGFEFLQVLRQEPQWRCVPIVIVTGKNLSSDDRRRLTDNVQVVLQKGDYLQEALLNEVREMLARERRAQGCVDDGGSQRT